MNNTKEMNPEELRLANGGEFNRIRHEEIRKLGEWLKEEEEKKKA